jgi:hypothetical protein
MACVWKGLINALDLGISPIDLLHHIQENNIDTSDMKCNGMNLTVQLQRGNKQHIDALTINEVKNGYFCSTCDPLFLLIGQIYSVSIEHDYMGVKIIYLNTKSKRKIYLKSNNRHMWADKDKNRIEKHKRRFTYNPDSETQ